MNSMFWFLLALNIYVVLIAIICIIKSRISNTRAQEELAEQQRRSRFINNHIMTRENQRAEQEIVVVDIVPVIRSQDYYNNNNNNGMDFWVKGDRVCDGCSICLEEFGDDDVAVLMCDHLFHVQCIAAWTANKKWCPLCRRSVDQVFLAKIYRDDNNVDDDDNKLGFVSSSIDNNDHGDIDLEAQ